MASPRHVTLANVARAAGLSLGGASYALRGHPSIPTETIARVKQLAATLGYRPNLRVSSLMATIRSGRPVTARETLAFVWVNTPKRTDKLPAHLQHFVQVILRGARLRAEQLGCRLEEFWLDARDLRPSRLNQILRTRGISGVVISPAASDEAITIDWDWRPFACAIIGNTDCSPELHRSAHYHYRSVWHTLDQCRIDGFIRPAAILSQSVQNRIHSMQLAAFLTNHPQPETASDFVRFGTPEKFAELRPWLHRLAPDALILGWQIDARTKRLLSGYAPSVRRMVTLEWYPQGALPGMDPCNEEIAANAVDLVIAQLHRNELGLPSRPTTLLLEGIWREDSA